MSLEGLGSYKDVLPSLVFYQVTPLTTYSVMYSSVFMRTYCLTFIRIQLPMRNM